MSLTAEQRAELEAELAALKKARTEILTGGKVNKVSFAGRNVEYGDPLVSTTNRLELRIKEIEMQLGQRPASRSRQVQF